MMIQALFQVVLQLMERVFLFLALVLEQRGNQFNGKQDNSQLVNIKVDNLAAPYIRIVTGGK